MKLVHYSREPLGELRPGILPPDDRGLMKPAGLWVSDDDCEDNWFAWCTAEDFRLDDLTHAHDVELAPGANVLVLSTPADIDAFSAEWGKPDSDTIAARWALFLNWRAVMARYDGIVITPYVAERRFGPLWYNIWDCASGCIWQPRAVASVKLRSNAR